MSMSTRSRALNLRLPKVPPRSALLPIATTLPGPSDARSDGDISSLSELDIKESIGMGSSGRVFAARHKVTQKKYAVKIIQANRTDPLEKQQLIKELRILRRAKSPYCVQCFGIFENPSGGVAIVLEYMERGSLVDVMEACKKTGTGIIEEKYIALILQQVLLGLKYLHKEEHIIHRDIKPSNLLMNNKAEIKIADFGVSTDLANSLAQANSVVGTCAYMSPERFNPDGYEGVKYTFSSDIWSLGLTLLELASGKCPFGHPAAHSDIPTLMAAISFDEPPKAPPGSSREFQQLMTECLQKDPRKRPDAATLLEHPFIKKFCNNPKRPSSLTTFLGTLI